MGKERGYCWCGCGQKTKLATKTNTKRGNIKGQPVRFLSGHHSRGENNPKWKGGKTNHTGGYKLIRDMLHPKKYSNNYVLEHILKAEKSLGKHLPPKAVVHHHNLTQLVICEDQAYHLLLHRRTNTLKECGHANWRRCQYCHILDSPDNLIIPEMKYRMAYHKNCAHEDLRKRKFAGFTIRQG